jgi:hypothetical protein
LTPCSCFPCVCSHFMYLLQQFWLCSYNVSFSFHSQYQPKKQAPPAVPRHICCPHVLHVPGLQPLLQQAIIMPSILLAVSCCSVHRGYDRAKWAGQGWIFQAVSEGREATRRRHVAARRCRQDKMGKLAKAQCCISCSPVLSGLPGWRHSRHPTAWQLTHSPVCSGLTFLLPGWPRCSGSPSAHNQVPSRPLQSKARLC